MPPLTITGLLIAEGDGDGEYEGVGLSGVAAELPLAPAAPDVGT